MLGYKKYLNLCLEYLTWDGFIFSSEMEHLKILYTFKIKQYKSKREKLKKEIKNLFFLDEKLIMYKKLQKLQVKERTSNILVNQLMLDDSS